MKKQYILITVLVAIAFLNSCDNETIRASDEVTFVDYAVSGYDGLYVSDAFDVFVFFSNTEEGVRIEANDNLHEKIVVEREGDQLVIRLTNNTSIRGKATLNAYITTSHLHVFEATGASDVVLENEWQVQEGRIQLSGASSLKGEILAENLETTLSGASDLDLFGAINSLNAQLSGSGEIRNYDLLIQHLDIDLSGSSDAFLSVNESIDVIATGASTLNYKGNATVKRSQVSGASEIRKRD